MLSDKERLLSLSEVAAYLNVAEKTVHRMIAKQEIPCLRVANQWRFIPRVLEDWLHSKMIAVPKNDLSRAMEGDTGIVPVSRLLRKDYIFPNLSPAPKEELLDLFSSRLAQGGIISEKEEYKRLLLEREQMVSTGLINGLAIPHPRNPRSSTAQGPLLLVGICPEGTEFDSMDGTPTRLFLLPVTDSEVVHLKIIAKISQIFRSVEKVNLLCSLSDPDEIIAQFIEFDYTSS